MTTAGPVTARVPATTANLGPGFDAFGVALDLHLEVEARPRGDDDPRVTSEGEGDGELPDGDDNLVWRSFLRGCEDAGVAPPDVALRVRNAIPLERGLGSSSAAIVAGLGLARALTGAHRSDRDLVTLATELEGHPDNVAPAVLGGFVCAARTDDGELVVRTAPPTSRLSPVVLVPQIRQATTDARAALPDVLERTAVIDQVARAGHVLGGITGLWPLDPRVVGDRLHEPARTAAAPVTHGLLAELRGAGFVAWLSGAGPSICVLVDRGDTAGLERLDAHGAAHDHRVRPMGWQTAGLQVSTGTPD